MKEDLMKRILAAIQEMNEEDIYALSLFVYDDGDDPCRPTVTLGYNTERHVIKTTPRASDEQEARWNYAFWLQNEIFCYGTGETAGQVSEWMVANGFSQDDDDEADMEEVTEQFVGELVEVVQAIHRKKVLTEKFGKEIPILIHELEYYDEIAEQNIRANGEEMTRDFADFCGW